MYRPKHVEWTCREINFTAHCRICWLFHRTMKLSYLVFIYSEFASGLREEIYPWNYCTFSSLSLFIIRNYLNFNFYLTIKVNVTYTQVIYTYNENRLFQRQEHSVGSDLRSNAFVRFRNVRTLTGGWHFGLCRIKEQIKEESSLTANACVYAKYFSFKPRHFFPCLSPQTEILI